jgi:hypothetical protein
MTNYTFDQLLDFTRTTSGTFVGSNGLIQTTPASVNLLLQTQQFDVSPWSNQVGGTGVAATVTANAGTAPDDTSTADRLQFSLAGGTTTADITRRKQDFSTPATTHTFSVYLRSTDGTSTYNMHIVSPTGATTNIVVTGSWQRFTVTGTGTGGVTSYSVGLRGGQSPANSNTADVLAWGAQLEVGSTATTYTRNNGGVYPPRFDYDPVTLQPKGILIEEQRTNLVLQSQTFDNASWIKTRSSVTADATTSPDGTVNADKLVEDATAANNHFTSQSVTTTAIAYTFTVYAKAAERGYVTLINSTVASGCCFDLITGVVGVASGATPTASTITDVGNGWYRCSITVTATAASNVWRINVMASNSANTAYNGDGTSGIYIYGAQLEAGAFPTSYIPTVASQVTRTPDICSIEAPNFAPWYNTAEGTLVAEFTLLPRTLSGTTVIAYNGSSNGRWSYLSSASARMNDGTNTAVAGSIGTPTAVNKTASALSSAGMAISLNGAAPGTSAYVGTFGPQDALDIGSQAGAASINGHIRSVQYYPVRLADFQLQALTA